MDHTRTNSEDSTWRRRCVICRRLHPLLAEKKITLCEVLVYIILKHTSFCCWESRESIVGMFFLSKLRQLTAVVSAVSRNREDFVPFALRRMFSNVWEWSLGDKRFWHNKGVVEIKPCFWRSICLHTLMNLRVVCSPRAPLFLQCSFVLLTLAGPHLFSDQALQSTKAIRA